MYSIAVLPIQCLTMLALYQYTLDMNLEGIVAKKKTVHTIQIIVRIVG